MFDRYVKTRAEEERLEKREALRAAMNGFRELLVEVAEVRPGCAWGCEKLDPQTSFFR